VLSELTNRLKDPKLTWYVARSFGGWVRRQAVTTSNPQLLYVCDEILCLPARFSEYIYWHDGQGIIVGRVFPNHQEAWDHTKETNPTTSAPYDGKAGALIGYSGYLLMVDLTDGTAKSKVYIVKRSYPELQILIFNKGTLTIRVNDPPATHGLTRYTTGTAGSGYVDLAQNQYVVYYKTLLPDVDTTNGVFSTSPLGTSKRYTYELYVDPLIQPDGFGIQTRLYLGIKAHKDMLIDFYALGGYFYGGSSVRAPINVSSMFVNTLPHIQVYDSDPYCSAGTYACNEAPIHIHYGWAEEDGTVKFIYISNTVWKHNTKWEHRTTIHNTAIYDVDMDEIFKIHVVRPEANIYSYGRQGAVQRPYARDADYKQEHPFPGLSANVAYAVKPDNTILTWSSPPGSYWVYADAWAFMNCFNSTNECLAASALGIYTDDASIGLTGGADARGCFGVCGGSDSPKMFGLQIKSFMDRTLYAGKTYAVVIRSKRFPRSATSSDLLTYATKKQPYVITASEWAETMNIPLFSPKFAGGKIPEGTIDFTVTGSPIPGEAVTVSGTCPIPSATVWLLLMDPDTYTVVAKNSGVADTAGSFTVSLTIPSTAPIGKKYKLYIICGK